MARNQKALRRFIAVGAIKVAPAVVLVTVVHPVVRPSDCACDQQSIRPLPANLPGPEERPEITQVVMEQVSSAASAGRGNPFSAEFSPEFGEGP